MTVPSLFASLCAAAGLSTREAADFLRVRDDTARSWSTGRREAPPDAIADLARIVTQLDRDAARLITESQASARRRKSREVTISLADTDAQRKNIPGLREALYGRVTAALMAEGYSLQDR